MPHIVFVYIPPIWEIMVYIFPLRKLFAYFKRRLIMMLIRFIWIMRKNLKVNSNMPNPFFSFPMYFLFLKRLVDNSFLIFFKNKINWYYYQTSIIRAYFFFTNRKQNLFSCATIIAFCICSRFWKNYSFFYIHLHNW